MDYNQRQQALKGWHNPFSDDSAKLAGMLARILWELATYQEPHHPFVPKCGQFDYSEYNIDDLHDIVKYADAGIAAFFAEKRANGDYGYYVPPVELQMMRDAASAEIHQRDVIFSGQPEVTPPPPPINWDLIRSYKY